MASALPLPEEKIPSAFSLLGHNQLRRLWLAQAVSWTGDNFSYLGLMIVINQMTGSAGNVALLVLVMTIPRLVFGMLAGVFVDRWNRQRLMIVSDLLRGLLSLCLIWAATPTRVWLIYPLAFAISSVGVFFVPARGAVMKTILKEDELLPANILMQTTLILTMVAGPALAGVTIGLFGVGPAYALDATTFFFSSALIATMTIAHIAEVKTGLAGLAAFWSEMKDGLAFVATNSTVAGLVLVLTIVSLSSGALNALIVPFLMNILGASAGQIGLTDSAQGVGMIIGSVLAAGIAARLRSSLIVCGGLAGVGLTVIGIGLSPTYLVMLILCLLLGLLLAPLQAMLPAITQKVVPNDKMGRVGGTMNTSQSVATLTSMGLASVFADIVGLRVIIVVAGAIAVVAGIVSLRAIRDD